MRLNESGLVGVLSESVERIGSKPIDALSFAKEAEKVFPRIPLLHIAQFLRFVSSVSGSETVA